MSEPGTTRHEVRPDPPLAAVRALLQAAGLPVSDLGGPAQQFFHVGPPGAPLGVAGLEIYGKDALLRSLVVAPGARGLGIGLALVDAIEAHARAAGVRRIYLLTETAREFFSSAGYLATPRGEAPAGIRGTREFASLCPASAAFMSKLLV